jgi:hypothetical protein
MLIHTDRWLVRQPGPQRRLRLFCFPCPGVGAACFRAWQGALHPHIEVCAVQLPGHGARFAEPPVASLAELVDMLGGVVAAEHTLPFAFFGHGFGAMLPFEVARRCRNTGKAMPSQVLVSGCAAPSQARPAARIADTPAHDVDGRDGDGGAARCRRRCRPGCPGVTKSSVTASGVMSGTSCIGYLQWLRRGHHGQLWRTRQGVRRC